MTLRNNSARLMLCAVAGTLLLILLLLLLRGCSGSDINLEAPVIAVPQTAVTSIVPDEDSQEAIMEELNRQAENSRITLSINTEPVFVSGISKGNLWIKNDAANRDDQIVEIIRNDTGDLIYTSEPIPAGKYIKDPKTARNKNVLIVGGSGSGKTRFWLKPNLMQMHSSYVVTDPKGSILTECGKMLQRGTPKLDDNGKPVRNGKGKIVYEPYRIKVFNTINFKKSMHYNPFSYIHSEKDILKLVTALITNTKGDGKSGDEFWTKAETLLYTALIGYMHYECPVEEQNFAALVEMINSMEVREDDEEFENTVDLLFKELKERKPNHFAARQYAKFKLAAGVINYKRFLIQSYERQPMAA